MSQLEVRSRHPALFSRVLRGMQIEHPGWRSTEPRKDDSERGRRGRQTALDLYLERFEKRGRQVAPQCLVVSDCALGFLDGYGS